LELTHEFRVGVPVEAAWAVLTDVEKIAPCMPGAELQEVEGEEFRGAVRVKVGPITAQYRGKARFLELDEEGRHAVLKAEGREVRGQGSATATIAATLRPDGDGTEVSLVTDLVVSGRVAQFGRGVLADVSSKLLDEFVESLEATVLSARRAGSGSAGDGSEPEGAGASPEPAEPVDLVELAGLPVARRLLPALGAALAAAAAVLLVRRRLGRG
jgi:carbon monoxide dehydrogenase subunit G